MTLLCQPSLGLFSPVEEPAPLVALFGRLGRLLDERGGIRPASAAVEEMTKLLLVVLAAERAPGSHVGDYGTLRSAVDSDALRAAGDVSALNAAFRIAAALPGMASQTPGGECQPVWPAEESLRISRADVAAEALELLAVCLHEARVSASVLDPLGLAFDVFLRGRYDHAGGMGTYLTPEQVTTAMATMGLDLVDPLQDLQDGPAIGDPCCGTGRFLMAAASALSARESGRDMRPVLGRALVGADQSTSAVAMARVNLLACGVTSPRVFVVEDSVTAPALDALRGRLRLILTNPPFGEGRYGSAEGIRRARQILPLAPAGRADPALVFVARCLELLADGGILGVVLPDGLVDGPVLRQALLGRAVAPRQVSVEARISLPASTFALTGTTVKTSAVFLRRGSPSSQFAFLARAAHVGYLKQAGALVADPAGNELPAVAETIRAARGCELPAAGVISEEPFVLRVARGDLTSLDLARVDPRATAARRSLEASGGAELRHLAAPTARRPGRALPVGTPFVSILHVGDLGTIDWQAACAYEPATPGIVAVAGEVIVSLLNPRKLRAAVVPERYPAIWCSAEFGVFAPSCHPYAVLALLQDERVRAQLAPLGKGSSSSRRRIEPSDVLRLVVPRRSEAWLDSRGDQVRRLIEHIEHAGAELERIYSEP